jgi:hypothetical protein
LAEHGIEHAMTFFLREQERVGELIAHVTQRRDRTRSPFRQRKSAPTATRFMNAQRKKQLSGKQVNAIVFRRLRKYDKLNFSESFAMFMGKAQLVEFGLKKVLMSKYGLEEEKIENWSLGQVIAELKKRGCRQDFVALLEELKERRNYIAHTILIDDAMMRRLVGSRAQRISWKSLSRGLYQVEEAIVVHDFLVTNELL